MKIRLLMIFLPSPSNPLLLGLSYLRISHVTAEKNTKANSESVKTKTTKPPAKTNKKPEHPPPSFSFLNCMLLKLAMISRCLSPYFLKNKWLAKLLPGIEIIQKNV